VRDSGQRSMHMGSLKRRGRDSHCVAPAPSRRSRNTSHLQRLGPLARTTNCPCMGESGREAHVSAGGSRRCSCGPRARRPERRELLRPHLRQRHRHDLLRRRQRTCGVWLERGRALHPHVNACPGVAGERFVSIIVDGNANTVVERVTYFNTGGELFVQVAGRWRPAFHDLALGTNFCRPGQCPRGRGRSDANGRD
jgi:hypothetical protein